MWCTVITVKNFSFLLYFYVKVYLDNYSIPHLSKKNYVFRPGLRCSSKANVFLNGDKCKYFYVKNPILVTSKLNYFGDGKWQISLEQRQTDLLKITSKLWITDQLYVRSEISFIKKATNQNIFSSVMPKIYRCDAKNVIFYYQVFYFNDLTRLISCAEKIAFNDITVKDENDSNVCVEKIIEVAVKAKKILSYTNQPNITSNTMKELIKLPHFSKLRLLSLNCIPETFDVENFYSYMKKNKHTKINLGFDDSISEVYKNRLEEIVDEIIATETHDYKPPFIMFNGVDSKKAHNLFQLYKFR